jgi:hypothetical protein
MAPEEPIFAMESRLASLGTRLAPSRKRKADEDTVGLDD